MKRGDDSRGDISRRRSLVRLLFEEYAAGLGIDLSFQGFDSELAGLPGKYAEPQGGIWLADIGGGLAGCIALRPLSVDQAAVKRLYVRPAFRGAGVGRLLAEHALVAASQKGYRSACLDTLPATMAGAVALYRSLGFREIEPYCHNPVAGALFMGKELSRAD